MLWEEGLKREGFYVEGLKWEWLKREGFYEEGVYGLMFSSEGNVIK